MSLGKIFSAQSQERKRRSVVYCIWPFEISIPRTSFYGMSLPQLGSIFRRQQFLKMHRRRFKLSFYLYPSRPQPQTVRFLWPHPPRSSHQLFCLREEREREKRDIYLFPFKRRNYICRCFPSVAAIPQRKIMKNLTHTHILKWEILESTILSCSALFFFLFFIHAFLPIPFVTQKFKLNQKENKKIRNMKFKNLYFLYSVHLKSRRDVHIA